MVAQSLGHICVCGCLSVFVFLCVWLAACVCMLVCCCLRVVVGFVCAGLFGFVFVLVVVNLVVRLLG